MFRSSYNSIMKNTSATPPNDVVMGVWRPIELIVLTPIEEEVISYVSSEIYR
jgi:hypothetical protein